MATAILGLYFLKIDLIPYAILSFALAGSLAAFLIFNFQPAKIFMGDTGSLLIGLITAILVIKFINVASSPLVSLHLDASPAIGFAILLIPLLDTLRVFSIRIIHRRSPFSPDRNHVHHLLLDRGFSHQKVTITLVSINLLFILLAYYGSSLGCTLLLFGIVSLFFAGIGFLYYTRSKRQLAIAKIRNREKEGKKVGSSTILLTNNALIEEK
jgi:UDP-N-acetylmuramyl pentapeptide phosphotransferase/UDP-N-acetylglucosamine-1-phosphate transferase